MDIPTVHYRKVLSSEECERIYKAVSGGENLTLTELIDRSYTQATDKGFFDRELSINDLLMQVVSEVGELYDAFRNGEGVDRISEETADIFISCSTLAGMLQAQYGMDMDIEVLRKLTMDKDRPQLHGKLF